MDAEIRHDADRSTYELVVDGEVAAHAVARDGEGDVTVMPHTVVDPARRGQGLGEVLVRGALDDLRRRGRRVVPTCWFVAEVMDRHDEYADLRVG